MAGAVASAMAGVRRCAPVLALGVLGAQAFYLPGVAPKEYKEGETVELKVNKLTSAKTQLPYSFYRLPHCEPDEIQHSAENLGEILVGDVIENSKYDIKMLKNETCKVLCQRKLDEQQKGMFRNMIDDEYLVNWIVDNLPAATRYVRSGNGGESFMYMNGFPVGVQKDGRYYVHNHVRLSLFFHAEPTLFEGYRVVGFEVEPHSVRQTVQGVGAAMTAECKVPLLDLDENQNLAYTYDIQWIARLRPPA